jgi:hypothetical protein
MKTKNLIFSGIVLLAAACTPAQPHIFKSSWQAPELPDYTRNPRNNITGSAFLLTRGGDAKTCAGSPVFLMPNIPKTAYEKELDSLSSRVREVTDIDPAFVAYKEKIRKLATEVSKSTKCNVDGKFNFKDVPAGDWVVETEVSWTVPTYSSWSKTWKQEKQGGAVYETLSIPDAAIGETFEVTVSSM